jgi:nucleotide-binding universal stress UspA family protein
LFGEFESRDSVTLSLKEALMKTPLNVQMGKILVPVDFSECSRSAVEYAASLATRFGSELFLVHVVEPYVGTGDVLLDMARIQATLEKDAKQELEEWAKQFQPAPHVILRVGSAAHEILETAKEIGAASIVIPSHGRSAIARFFMGGVAERVVRYASCPVIVLPWKKRFTANQNPFSEPQRSNQRQAAAETVEVL